MDANPSSSLRREMVVADGRRPTQPLVRITPDRDDRFIVAVKAEYVAARSRHESAINNMPVQWVPPRSYTGAPRRQSHDTGYNTRKTEDVWEWLAAKVVEHNVPVLAYFDFVFSRAGLSRRPEPKQMFAEGSVTLFFHSRAELASSLGTRLESQQKLANAEISFVLDLFGNAEDAICSVLASSNSSIAPLYAYCIACSCVDMSRENLDRKAEDRFLAYCRRFEIAAALEYLRAPAEYHQAWDAVLPSDMLERANDIHLDHVLRLVQTEDTYEERSKDVDSRDNTDSKRRT